LSKFRSRTVYSNIANDVPVSFRTSSLYFVDTNNLFSNNRDVNRNYNNGDNGGGNAFDIQYNVTLIDQIKHVSMSLSPPDVSSDYVNRCIGNSCYPILHDKVYTPDEISTRFPPNDNDDDSVEEKIA